MGIEGAAALEVVLKATVVLAAAGFIDAITHRASATRRHALWVTACAIVLLLPLCQWTLPALRILPRWAAPTQDTGAHATAIPTTASPPIAYQPTLAANSFATSNLPAAAEHREKPAENITPAP